MTADPQRATVIPDHLPERLAISLWDFSWYVRTGPGEPERVRVPGAVTAAAVLVYIMAGLNVLYGVAGIAMAISGDAGGVIFGVISLGIAALMVFLLAKGLREGRRGARVVAIVIGSFVLLLACSTYGQGYMLSTVALLAGFGLALILLVTVPESSRAWFRRR